MSSTLQTFQDILQSNGLAPAEIIADGKLHRCPTAAKLHKQNGAYIAHLDSPATLWWCNWESSAQDTFTENTGKVLSPAEKEALQQRQAAIRQQRDAEFAQRQATAAQKAQNELNAAEPCTPEHPYLLRKGIPPLADIRQDRAGTLLIPIRNAVGQVQSLQRIAPDGEKRFLTGGKVHGGHCVIQGKPEKPFALCEGYATGASIHLASDYTVYVAFSAQNLPVVADMVRRQFPDKFCPFVETMTRRGAAKPRKQLKQFTGGLSFQLSPQEREQTSTICTRARACRKSAASWKPPSMLRHTRTANISPRWCRWTWDNSFPCPFPNGGFFSHLYFRYKA